MLSSDTKEMYGLGESSTPNDIFQALYFTSFQGQSIMKVTVVDPDGNPVKIARLNVVKSSGNLTNIQTSLNGSYIFVTKSDETVKISINPAMIDITGNIETTAASSGFKDVTLFVEFVDFVQLTSSKQISFSSSCLRLDMSLCAGGGGGGPCGYLAGGSSGGAGGDAAIYENVLFNPGETQEIAVGSGGARGVYQSTGTFSNGKSGGDSSGFGYSVFGGSGGIGKSTATVTGNNGNGGGGGKVTNVSVPEGGSYPVTSSGAKGTAGTKSIFSSFTETTLCGGGGGGGGYVGADSKTASAANGGLPNGGKGMSGNETTFYVSAPSNAGGGGGGGLGGIEFGYSHTLNGYVVSTTQGQSELTKMNGYRGEVSFRMWH